MNGHVAFTGNYADVAIENVSMGSAPDENWRFTYNGTNIKEKRLDLVTALALASSERQYMNGMQESHGDDSESRFTRLKRTNSNADWVSWQNPQPTANGDAYYRFVKNAPDDLSTQRY